MPTVPNRGGAPRFASGIYHGGTGLPVGQVQSAVPGGPLMFIPAPPSPIVPPPAPAVTPSPALTSTAALMSDTPESWGAPSGSPSSSPPQTANMSTTSPAPESTAQPKSEAASSGAGWILIALALLLLASG